MAAEWQFGWPRWVVGAIVAGYLGVVPAVVANARAERIAGPVIADVVAVVDGDTLRVRIRIWLGQELETLVRLDGIDAPEISGKCPNERELAGRARGALAAMVVGGLVLLTDIRHDKYAGRVVARVKDRHGGDLGDRLVVAGLARRYDGSVRRSWCPEGSGPT